jgi:hypothetical protein
VVDVWSMVSACVRATVERCRRKRMTSGAYDQGEEVEEEEEAEEEEEEEGGAQRFDGCGRAGSLV